MNEYKEEIYKRANIKKKVINFINDVTGRNYKAVKKFWEDATQRAVNSGIDPTLHKFYGKDITDLARKQMRKSQMQAGAGVGAMAGGGLLYKKLKKKDDANG